MIKELSMCFAMILVTFPSLSGSHGSSATGQAAPIEEELLEQDPKQAHAQTMEAMRVKAAADHFVRRFHATLDFRTVFEEMFVSDAGQRLRKSNFFEGLNIKDELVTRLDDSRLRGIYEGFMNLYYLRMIYDFGQPLSQDPKSSDSHLPLEIISAIKSSPFKELLSDPVTTDSPVIGEETQLTSFMKDLKRVADLYRKHLPRQVFNSRNYKANVRELNYTRKVGFQIKNGFPELGVPDNTKVYVYEKDIFIMVFLEEGGQLKILTLIPD